MKASHLTRYGSADHFVLRDIARPEPKDDEMLIKIFASSINSWDWEIVNATPFINRLMVGLFKPSRIQVLGCDIAGRVEAVGSRVTRFQVGDEVFGDISSNGWGGFAEYSCVSEKADVLAIKPADMTFEQAASIPQAAVLALQGLRQGNIQSGQNILINGAGGGVGSFAIQIAKTYDVEMTCVDGPDKFDFMSSLGADQVIDYTQQDFTRNGRQYDLILDIQGYHSLADYRRALKQGGVYVMVGGSMSLAYQLMLLKPWISMTDNKKMGILMHKPNARDLALVSSYFDTGHLVPCIDRTFRLDEIVPAMRYFSTGRVKGKLVIAVQPDEPPELRVA